MASILFSPIKLRDVELPNRTVVAPMCQYSAFNGTATDWHLMHLGQFAVGGTGLVFVEATGVEPEGRITPGCVGLYSDQNEEALARVRQNTYDLVICDLKMPKVDGIAFYRAIAAASPVLARRVIFVTVALTSASWSSVWTP